jgi:hypothetical protein
MPLQRSEGRKRIVVLVLVVCSMVPAADVESQKTCGEIEPDDV